MSETLKTAVRRFGEAWFPEGCVEHPLPVWFGARKRKHRSQVQALVTEFQGPLSELISLVDDGCDTVDKDNAGGPAERDVSSSSASGDTAPLFLSHWPPTDRLLAAVLIDQMSRNWAALDGLPASISERADPAAFALASEVAAAHFNENQTSGVSCGTAIFCFFTLVFRHSNEITNVDKSIRLLERALAGHFSAVVLPHGSRARDLCERFLIESCAKKSSLESEVYIRDALETHMPALIGDAKNRHAHDLLDSGALDMGVLDELCRQWASEPAQFLAVFASNTHGESCRPLLVHPTVSAMDAALMRDGVSSGDALLLSLSGGVDSTAHAVMLALLQPKFGYRLGALHIHHLNRDDAEVEQRWVQFLASRLGISLYSYTVRLQRPHGDERTGISRERYEDVTKQIRFRMYRLGLDMMTQGADDGRQLVVLGHHADDADENRLAELGKGNVVNVDGMAVLSKCMGVVQYRPLLAIRKQAMYDLAEASRIPFMADSTPLWSRRGWTRRLLDNLSPTDRTKLLQHLDELGASSSDLGHELERVGDSYTAVCVKTLEGWPPPAGVAAATISDERSRHSPATREELGRIAAVRLSSIPEMTERVSSILIKVLDITSYVAAIWNPAIAACAQVDNFKGGADQPPCPIQSVLVHERIRDAEAFVFVSNVKRQLVRPDVLPFLNGGQVAGKALAHILSMVRDAKDKSAPIWSTLNSRCPCVWVPHIGTLVIYDERLMPEMARAATMKRKLIAACTEQLGEGNLE
eukprot:m.468711 g.468711  ORF g.468711 m.468711 type:complete len:755 (-) comp27774_c0_seq1:941-3205(-)